MTARQYRVRIFEGRYEVLSDRVIETVYDRHETGHMAVRQGSSLDALLWNLTAIAHGLDSTVDTAQLRLVLCDIDDDERPVFDWVARS